MKLECLYDLNEDQMYEIHQKVEEYERKNFLLNCWLSTFEDSILKNLNDEELNIATNLFIEKYLDMILIEYNNLLEDGYCQVNELADNAFDIFSEEMFLKDLAILLKK